MILKEIRGRFIYIICFFLNKVLFKMFVLFNFFLRSLFKFIVFVIGFVRYGLCFGLFDFILVIVVV